MFYSCQFDSGYATELEGVGKREFNFTSGINVIYGPNGSGKTTLLKTLAAYTGLDMTDKNFGGGAGWSRPASRSFIRDEDDFNLMDHFAEHNVGQCVASVLWDGTPAFYNSASLSDSTTMTHMEFDANESADGLTDVQVHLAMLQGHMSEGEMRKFKIVQLLRQLESPPDPYTKAERNSNRLEKEYAKHIRKLRKVLDNHDRDSRITLLWDEPDRSLDAQKQFEFWTAWAMNIHRKLNVQIIATSHSYVPPLLSTANAFNVIELEDGACDSMVTNVNVLLSLREEYSKKEDEDVENDDETAEETEVEATENPSDAEEPVEDGTDHLMNMDEG